MVVYTYIAIWLYRYKFMAIDWTKIFEKYKGLWIALEDDEETVVGSGKRAQDALTEARENGISKPILFRMPKELVNFAGYEVSV
jgi:hypothetical protein